MFIKRNIRMLRIFAFIAFLWPYHTFAAVQSVPPIFLFSALDRNIFRAQVHSADAAGCREAEALYCQARGCGVFDQSRYEPYLYISTICYNRYSNFGVLGPVCPVAIPSYLFNPTTGLCERPAGIELSVSSAPPIIPISSRVENRKILTKSILGLSLQQGGSPAPGILAGLTSNRGNLDVISGPSIPTDANGKSTAVISTRNQPGLSTVTGSDTANIQTVQPGVINWLPANYESEFTVTCYTIANEADWPSTPTQNKICGLPPENVYRSKFLSDTMMQGSGTTLDGKIIHYDISSKCFNLDTCARTSSNRCAVVGTTIAVDPKIMPRGDSHQPGSTVNVAILGQRNAQDGGSRIKGYRIDEYMGPAPKACAQFGKQKSRVTFISY